MHRVHLEVRAHRGHTVKATTIRVPDHHRYQHLPPSPASQAAAWAQSGADLPFLIQNLDINGTPATEKAVKGLTTEPLGTLSTYGDKKGDGVGGREAGRTVGGEPEGISTQENLT